MRRLTGLHRRLQKLEPPDKCSHMEGSRIHFKEKSSHEVKASISQHQGRTLEMIYSKDLALEINEQIQRESTLTSKAARQGCNQKEFQPPALRCFHDTISPRTPAETRTAKGEVQGLTGLSSGGIKNKPDHLPHPPSPTQQ